MISSMLRAFAIGFVVASAGCIGQGTGTVAGTLYLRGCTQTHDYGSLAAPSAYDMHPSFFVGDPINVPTMINNGTSQPPLHPIDKLTIRVQREGKPMQEADLLYVDIADDAQVAATLGQPLTIGPTTVVRASLTLAETCPNAEVEPELDGTMTFSRFGGKDVPDGDGIQFGDHVTASFSLDVVDRRAISLGGVSSVPVDPSASGHLDGDFDFEVRQGIAGQQF